MYRVSWINSDGGLTWLVFSTHAPAVAHVRKLWSELRLYAVIRPHGNGD